MWHKVKWQTQTIKTPFTRIHTIFINAHLTFGGLLQFLFCFHLTFYFLSRIRQRLLNQSIWSKSVEKERKTPESTTWLSCHFAIVVSYNPTIFYSVWLQCCKMLRWKPTQLQNRSQTSFFYLSRSVSTQKPEFVHTPYYVNRNYNSVKNTQNDQKKISEFHKVNTANTRNWNVQPSNMRSRRCRFTLCLSIRDIKVEAQRTSPHSLVMLSSHQPPGRNAQSFTSLFSPVNRKINF